MKLDCHIIINFSGSFCHGECAIALVIKDPEAPAPYLKIYGYKNLSYQRACAIAVYRLAVLCYKLRGAQYEADITVSDPYTYHMLNRDSYDGVKNSDIWKRYQQIKGFVKIHRNKESQFKAGAIKRTEKGGYYMIDAEKEDIYGDGQKDKQS